MGRKPTARAEFIYVDVTYEDGTQRSNRKLPVEVLKELDPDGAIKALVEHQDREIAEKSGLPPRAVKSIRRLKK